MPRSRPARPDRSRLSQWSGWRPSIPSVTSSTWSPTSRCTSTVRVAGPTPNPRGAPGSSTNSIRPSARWTVTGGAPAPATRRWPSRASNTPTTPAAVSSRSCARTSGRAEANSSSTGVPRRARTRSVWMSSRASAACATPCPVMSTSARWHRSRSRASTSLASPDVAVVASWAACRTAAASPATGWGSGTRAACRLSITACLVALDRASSSARARRWAASSPASTAMTTSSWSGLGRAIVTSTSCTWSSACSRKRHRRPGSWRTSARRNVGRSAGATWRAKEVCSRDTRSRPSSRVMLASASRTCPVHDSSARASKDATRVRGSSRRSGSSVTTWLAPVPASA